MNIIWIILHILSSWTLSSKNRLYSKERVIKRGCLFFKINDQLKWTVHIDIIRPKPRHKHRYANNVKSVSVWWCLCILSNTWGTFEAQFIKKLSNTEAELKKKRYLKKSLFPAVNYMFKVNNRNTKTRCEIFSYLVYSVKMFIVLKIIVFRTLSTFLLSVIIYFHQKALSWISERVLNTPLINIYIKQKTISYLFG